MHDQLNSVKLQLKYELIKPTLWKDGWVLSGVCFCFGI